MSRIEANRVNLHILSPIHVGSGQELDPFSYVIRNSDLLLIDLVKWMADYEDKDTLRQMMNSDNFAEVRSFISEKFDSDAAVLAKLPVESPKLLNTYSKVIRDKDPRNQVLVEAMTRNEIEGIAYIPGSSIKGAIRTAIANRFTLAAKVGPGDGHKGAYSRKIFGAVNVDPMRYLKVGDISLQRFGSAIVEAVGYPLKEDKTLTPKGFKEVSLSICQTGEEIVYPLKLSLTQFGLHGQKVNLPFIVEALHDFYVPKYENEYRKFFDSPRALKIQHAISPMNVAVANLKSNETLIRIGHFSHVECVTLDEVRRPVTRFVKGRRMPWGTTRTLANGILPFGWAKLEFLDLESKPRNEKKWPFSTMIEEDITRKPSSYSHKKPLDSEQVRKEKITHFKAALDHSQNISGDIDLFIGMVNNQDEEVLSQKLCRILLEKAMGLPKKKKFTRALADGKKWAERLKALCDEAGIDIQEE